MTYDQLRAELIEIYVSRDHDHDRAAAEAAVRALYATDLDDEAEFFGIPHP